MSPLESGKSAIGKRAPDFTLPDTVSGKSVSLKDYPVDKGLLVMFICNHCPYVIHLIEPLVELCNSYQSKGIGTIAISANDVVEYPADSPDKMTELAGKYGFNFPYLYDETQETAKAYEAVCTPDFYLLDSKLNFFYRGRFDNSTPGNKKPVTGDDLRNAFESLLAGKAYEGTQYPSMGCGVKWKKN